MFTAKFHNTFGTIGPHFWRTLNHAFFTFIYSQIDWNLHVFPYHKFYFPEIDKLLRTSQRAFLDISRFHLSNKAHDCFTGYVTLHDRWLYLFTTFLIKLLKRNNCALSHFIRSFILEDSSQFPLLSADWTTLVHEINIKIVFSHVVTIENNQFKISKTYKSELKQYLNNRRNQTLTSFFHQSKAPWAHNLTSLQFQPQLRRCFYFPESAESSKAKLFLQLLFNYNKWAITNSCPGCNILAHSLKPTSYLKKTSSPVLPHYLVFTSSVLIPFNYYTRSSQKIRIGLNTF